MSGNPPPHIAGLNPKEQERRRRATFGIIRSLIILGGLIAVGVLYYLRPEAAPIVERLVLASALDEQYLPVESVSVYEPDDTFYVSVRLSDYRGEEPLVARWLFEEDTIIETPLESASQGSGYAGFVLRNNEPPWPIGSYRVEIVYQDKILASVAFEVVSENGSK